MSPQEQIFIDEVSFFANGVHFRQGVNEPTKSLYTSNRSNRTTIKQLGHLPDLSIRYIKYRKNR